MYLPLLRTNKLIVPFTKKTEECTANSSARRRVGIILSCMMNYLISFILALSSYLHYLENTRSNHPFCPLQIFNIRTALLTNTIDTLASLWTVIWYLASFLRESNIPRAVKRKRNLSHPHLKYLINLSLVSSQASELNILFWSPSAHLASGQLSRLNSTYLKVQSRKKSEASQPRLLILTTSGQINLSLRLWWANL